MTEVNHSPINCTSIFESPNIIDNQIEILTHVSPENITQLRSLLEQSIFLLKKSKMNQEND
jgi:hypothetical protein